jgi:Mg2+-importing ATPase
VLGLACRDVTDDPVINKDDEQDMTFTGFLLFDDPPKAGAAEAIQELRQLGVSLKVITGDNRLVAQRLGAQMGIASPEVLTGDTLHQMNDAALINRVSEVDIFAETEPNQKERILIALRKAGHVVGYLGDGINDASALHAADVGISVDGAVDVAKEAADILIMNDDLRRVPETVLLSKRTYAILWQNIIFALGIKAVFFVLAVFGNASMWMAVFADMGASLLVVFNGLRLLRGRK